MDGCDVFSSRRILQVDLFWFDFFDCFNRLDRRNNCHFFHFSFGDYWMGLGLNNFLNCFGLGSGGFRFGLSLWYRFSCGRLFRWCLFGCSCHGSSRSLNWWYRLCNFILFSRSLFSWSFLGCSSFYFWLNYLRSWLHFWGCGSNLGWIFLIGVFRGWALFCSSFGISCSSSSFLLVRCSLLLGLLDLINFHFSVVACLLLLSLPAVRLFLFISKLMPLSSHSLNKVSRSSEQSDSTIIGQQSFIDLMCFCNP